MVLVAVLQAAPAELVELEVAAKVQTLMKPFLTLVQQTRVVVVVAEADSTAVQLKAPVVLAALVL